jgi:hypothetical protein
MIAIVDRDGRGTPTRAHPGQPMPGQPSNSPSIHGPLIRDGDGSKIVGRNAIRGEDDYLRIAAYILDNPRCWKEDSLNDE